MNSKIKKTKQKQKEVKRIVTQCSYYLSIVGRQTKYLT